MKKKEKTAAGHYFRILFVPAMFIYALIRASWVRCCAAGVMAAWFAFWIMQKKSAAEQKRKERPREENAVEPPEKDDSVLLRTEQRITEELQKLYPLAEWRWIHRPDAEELQNGGSWCIRLSGAGPCSYGAVSLREAGDITVTPLAEIREQEKKEEPAMQKETDLEYTEEKECSDAEVWYSGYACDVLAALIDDQNARGQKWLTIRDDGEILALRGRKETAVGKLEGLPPRRDWPEIRELMREDGIRATEERTGLVLNWQKGKYYA